MSTPTRKATFILSEMHNETFERTLKIMHYTNSYYIVSLVLYLLQRYSKNHVLTQEKKSILEL